MDQLEFNISDDSFITDEQSCFWRVKNPLKEDYYIKGDSNLTIVLEEFENAEVYMYKSVEDNRSYSESMVQYGDQLYPGNPLRLFNHDDFLVIFKKNDLNEETGRFKLVYTKSGDKYPFWRKPFLDHGEGLWYTVYTLFFMLLFTLFFLLIHVLCVRPCCLNKPLCCCSYRKKKDKDVKEKPKKEKDPMQSKKV